MYALMPVWQLVERPPESDIHVNMTTPEANQTATATSDHVWLQRTLSDIRMTFLPIIVAGTITNCLNFVVLTHREMRTVNFTLGYVIMVVSVLNLATDFLDITALCFVEARILFIQSLFY